MPCQGPWGGGYGHNDYRQDYLEAERRLCEARWIILELTKHAGPLPKPLVDLVAAHKVAQLEHRRGDKKHVLAAIASTMRRLHDDQKRIISLGGTPGEHLQSHLDELAQEQAKIRALSDDELLEKYWGTEVRLDELVDH